MEYPNGLYFEEADKEHMPWYIKQSDRLYNVWEDWVKSLNDSEIEPDSQTFKEFLENYGYEVELIVPLEML